MTEINELLNNAQSIARIILERVLTPGARVVDATLGNGQDALYLAEKVGPQGYVWAFDVQAEAIENARRFLPERVHARVRIIHDSHENMAAYIQDEVVAVLFNLGYLPRGNRAVTTTQETTVRACSEALSLVAPGGIVLCVVYRGHEEGRLEWDALIAFGAALDQNTYNFFHLDFPNQAHYPPGLIAFQKR